MKKILSVFFILMLLGTMLLPAFAEEDHVIKEVYLTVTEPAIGEAPAEAIVSAESEKYTAKKQYWIKKLYSNETVTVFEGGYEYGLVFEVTPAPGYKFETAVKNQYNFNESPTVVYVNGQKTHCVASETDSKLVRAYDVMLENPPEETLGFFAKIIKAVTDFFDGIRYFFEHLFPKV